MSKKGFIYILSNKNRTVFYTGVTSNLLRRISEHKDGIGSSFTKRYNVTELLYYCEFQRMYEAIQSEKRVKKWHRSWKIELIKSINPDMIDLWAEISSLGQNKS